MLDETSLKPRVSVITMTFNRPAALARCLESVANQSLENTAFELVLVDVSDHAQVQTVAPFQHRINIRHLHTYNRGVAGNRNYGAQHARGAWLAFLDDDCIARPDWLEKLMSSAQANPGCLVGGGISNPNPDNAYACAGQVISEAVDECFNPDRSEPAFFPGLNFMVPRDAYQALGGNDEGFGRLAAEDREFIDRWRRSGRHLVKAGDAIVSHEHRSDFRGFVRQYFNYGKGAWRYHKLTGSRGANTLDEATKLHRGLWGYARKPLADLSPAMRVKIVFLLLVWELANVNGFVWQAGQDFFGRRFKGVKQ